MSKFLVLDCRIKYLQLLKHDRGKHLLHVWKRIHKPYPSKCHHRYLISSSHCISQTRKTAQTQPVKYPRRNKNGTLKKLLSKKKTSVSKKVTTYITGITIALTTLKRIFIFLTTSGECFANSSLINLVDIDSLLFVWWDQFVGSIKVILKNGTHAVDV